MRSYPAILNFEKKKTKSVLWDENREWWGEKSHNFILSQFDKSQFFFQYKYDLDMFHQIHIDNLGVRNPTSDENNMTCNKMHKVRKGPEKK